MGEMDNVQLIVGIVCHLIFFGFMLVIIYAPLGSDKQKKLMDLLILFMAASLVFGGSPAIRSFVGFVVLLWVFNYLLKDKRESQFDAQNRQKRYCASPIDPVLEQIRPRR